MLQLILVILLSVGLIASSGPADIGRTPMGGRYETSPTPRAGAGYSQPERGQIILEAYTEDGVCTNGAELRAAADILGSWLEAEGYVDVAVSQEGNKLRVHIPGLDWDDRADVREDIVEAFSRPQSLTFLDADGKVWLDESQIEGASAENGSISLGGPRQNYVLLTFTSEGAEAFYEATQAAAARAAENKNYLSIRLGREVISRPRVTEAIQSEDCIISGDLDDPEDAEELAALINAAVWGIMFRVAS